MDFNAAELRFEGAEIPPGMLRFVCRRNAPQVVPFVAQRPGFAHDLEMKQVRSHNVSVNVA